MADRAQDRFWIAEPDDMLEKLRHDRERLQEGIRNLRDAPREAHYVAYDFFITAWQTADEWVDDLMFGKDNLFDLAQDVANGVKHVESDAPKEETYDEGDFSQDFSHDFDIDYLYLRVTEERAQAVEEAAVDYGLDPIIRDRTKISVLVLADRLIERLEQEIQEGST